MLLGRMFLRSRARRESTRADQGDDLPLHDVPDVARPVGGVVSVPLNSIRFVAGGRRSQVVGACHRSFCCDCGSDIDLSIDAQFR